MCVHMFMVVAS